MTGFTEKQRQELRAAVAAARLAAERESQQRAAQAEKDRPRRRRKPRKFTPPPVQLSPVSERVAPLRVTDLDRVEKKVFFRLIAVCPAGTIDVHDHCARVAREVVRVRGRKALLEEMTTGGVA